MLPSGAGNFSVSVRDAPFHQPLIYRSNGAAPTGSALVEGPFWPVLRQQASSSESPAANAPNG
jgi:hypothetical protein